jgi:protocatechuate 4,5-dioxygenase alpha chain
VSTESLEQLTVAGWRAAASPFQSMNPAAMPDRHCRRDRRVLIQINARSARCADRYKCNKMTGRTPMRHHNIPGTILFDGTQAQKGLALNRMCFSFNSADNRAAFLKDEDGYCAKYGLTPEQREAVRERNVLKMIAVGGNVYYLAKLAGIFGLNVQDIGAQQTGMSVADFKAKLVAAGR